MEAGAEEEALLLAEVGRRRIALPAAAVAGVLPMLPLWRPPSLPAPVAGFARLRGHALPVLSAARLLGEAERPPGLYAHILRLRGVREEGGAGETGLLVDRAADLVRGAARLPLDPADTLGGCAAALIAQGETTAHLLVPERLLAAAERAALDALAADAERRLAEWAPAA